MLTAHSIRPVTLLRRINFNALSRSKSIKYIKEVTDSRNFFTGESICPLGSGSLNTLECLLQVKITQTNWQTFATVCSHN